MKIISDFTKTNIEVFVKTYNNNLECTNITFQRNGKSVTRSHKPGMIPYQYAEKIWDLYEFVQMNLKELCDLNMIHEDPEIILPYVWTSASGFSTWCSQKNMSKSTVYRLIKLMKKLGLIIDYKQHGYGKDSRILLSPKVCAFKNYKPEWRRKIEKEQKAENLLYMRWKYSARQETIGSFGSLKEVTIKDVDLVDKPILPKMGAAVIVDEMKKNLIESVNEDLQRAQATIKASEGAKFLLPIKKDPEFMKLYYHVTSLWNRAFSGYFKHLKYVSLSQKLFALQQLLTLLIAGYKYELIEEILTVQATYFRKKKNEEKMFFDKPYSADESQQIFYNDDGEVIRFRDYPYKPQLPSTFFNITNENCGFMQAYKKILRQQQNRHKLPDQEATALQLWWVQNKITGDAIDILLAGKRKNISKAVDFMQHHAPDRATEFSKQVSENTSVIQSARFYSQVK